jgi:CRISPR-associated exonuclease Cas4
MELLIVADFTWSNDASWAKLLDFKLDEVPELNIARLPRATVAAPPGIQNQQSAEVFAAEQSRLREASPTIRWIRPSDHDPDVIPIQMPSASGEEEPVQPASSVAGSRMRGVLLHKLMEELVTGELEEIGDAVTSRARLLLDQLIEPNSLGNPPEPEELANTALETIQLPEIKPFRKTLTAEMPIYGAAPTNPDHLIGGRADAVAQAEEGSRIVFDWKSDIAPKDEDRAAHRQQIGQYLQVTGARRGAVVYMTSGRVDWVSAS